MSKAKACSRAWQAEAVADGRLEGPDRAAFERHALACPDCATEARAIARVRATFALLPDHAATPLEHRRARMQLLARASERAAPAQRWHRWLALSAIGAACVAAVLFIRHAPDRSTAPPAVGFEITDIRAGRWATVATGTDVRVRQSGGVIRVRVDHLKPSEHFILELPNGEVEVRGTLFVVGVRDGATESVEVIEGTVAVRLDGASDRVLHAGESWSPAPRLDAGISKPSIDVRDLPQAPPFVHARSSADASSPSASSFEAAVGAFDVGDYGRADVLLDEFARAHRADPRAEDASFMRVVAQVRIGDASKARALAQEYLDRYPNGLRRIEAQRIANEP